MKPLIEMTLQELATACSCSQDAKDGEAPACEACFIRGALEAGIPRSVVAGKTKLTDHFSESYIKSQCSKPYPQPDIDICSECGEHAEFDEGGSNCCGAGSYDTDPDTDMER